MTNKDKWNRIVELYKINYNKKEDYIQKLWEYIFYECLGYSQLNEEIDTHRIIRLGSTDRVIPDIILKKDNQDLFVTELKQYNIGYDIKIENQLFSYLKQLKCNIGLLICNKIYIYVYDYAKNDSEQIKFEIPFEKDIEDGIKFIELFSKDTFDRKNIQEFIILKTATKCNIKKIKEKINSVYVLGLIKQDLAKTYSNEEIEESLKEISINVNEKIEVPIHLERKYYKNENMVDTSVVNDLSFARLNGEKIQDWIKRDLLIFEKDNLLTEQEIYNLQDLDYCKDN